jgi:predicted  nucleic acid-binding Zn-ribbon protein
MIKKWRKKLPWLAVSTARVVQYNSTPSQARRTLQKENFLPMSMTKIAASLYQLQQIDLDLERLIAEQQALVNSLQGGSTLKKLRTENNIAQQQLQTGLQAQKEAEWALEELDSRLRRQEQRLYSGGVTNPKELYALQQEVQHLRAQQSRQEEMALEVILATESLQKEAHDTAEALRLAEDTWAEANAAGVIRRDQVELKRQELQKKREQFAAGIDAEFLKRYDTLRRTKQGRAVSKVEQNSCQWCRVILTPSEMQRVRASADLQLCSNCGRILYYDR